jgi:DNA-binding NarL/FixJ family response regulator
MKTTRVLLADDHILVRAGIRSLLEKMTGIEVAAKAGDGREALELIKNLLARCGAHGHCYAGANRWPNWSWH